MDKQVLINTLNALGAGSKGSYLKQQLKDKLTKDKHYVHEQGKDMSEILNWR